MENNTQGNENKSPNPEERDDACRDWRDWREERRRWRHEMREHHHGWPFHGLFWGMGLVLVGVLILLNQTGHLTGDAWWQWLMVGLGGIMVVNGIARLGHPVFRWGSWGKFMCGGMLILIGSLLLAGVSHWWPVVLIAAGGAYLLRFFWRQSVSS